MPRRPRCHRRFNQALAFPRFMRSLALATTSSTPRRKVGAYETDRKVDQRPCDSGSANNKPVKDKNELSESTDEEDFEGVVQADFEFFDPKPEDFHGVKILLQNYLDDTEWDLSGFVDLILAQTTVGTVVKVADDEDDGLFSVATALNMARYKDNSCIKELKDYILKVCPEKSLIADVRSLLEERSDVGLLVSRRVVNLPPQLLPPLYDSLFDEVSWATEDEPTEELRKSFRFKSYLLVTKMYKLKKVEKRKKSKGNDDEDTIFVKPEDEIFLNLSSWSFTFPLHIQPVSAPELRNYRMMGLIMGIEADKIPEFRNQLKSLIEDP